VISGVHRDVHDIYALLGYYAALSCSSVPTFRVNVSVPSSIIKKLMNKGFLLEILDQISNFIPPPRYLDHAKESFQY
jgi:hypothetical protein